ncbi:hypothetical protein ABIB40_001249 [Pedobacter sp. UYP30]|uniref:isoleucyl-tRNA synthetase n=1 Tax=Pedobacter sp. UYP30 TaxID=1756400 RepID=UPI00339B5B48
MVKLLRLQRPLILIVFGVLAYIAGKILKASGIQHDYYLTELSGFLLIVGACWTMYPILFAKKDNDGNVEIITDPTVEVPNDTKPTEE